MPTTSSGPRGDPGANGCEALKAWKRIYHARDVADPDVVLSAGLFDGSLDELRAAQSAIGRNAQVGRIDPLVAEVLLDGSYEIVEELTP